METLRMAFHVVRKHGGMMESGRDNLVHLLPSEGGLAIMNVESYLARNQRKG